MDFFEREEFKKECRKRRIKVSVPQHRVERAKELAGQRNEKEKKFGAMTYGDKLSGIDAHVKGILGEDAVAYYFGKQVDATIFDDRGDHGIDLNNVPGYGMVGVKTTTYGFTPGQDVFLNVEVEHFSSCVDTYILCVVNPDLKGEVWLTGWASKEEVAAAPRKRYRIGTQWGPLNCVLPEHELHGFDRKNGRFEC